jgi:hypothetical protein
MRGDRPAAREEPFHRLAHGDADQTHRVAGHRAAYGDAIGIICNETYGVERDLQPFGDELREAGFVTLAAGHRADDQLHFAVGAHRQFGTLPRDTAGHLDVLGHRDTAAKPAAGGLRLARCEALPVRPQHRLVHTGHVIAVVVGDADRGGERHRAGRNEIPQAELDPVKPVPGCGKINQPLDHVDRLGAPRTTVDGNRRRIGQDGVARKCTAGIR